MQLKTTENAFAQATHGSAGKRHRKDREKTEKNGESDKGRGMEEEMAGRRGVGESERNGECALPSKI